MTATIIPFPLERRKAQIEMDSLPPPSLMWFDEAADFTDQQIEIFLKITPLPNCRCTLAFVTQDAKTDDSDS